MTIDQHTALFHRPTLVLCLANLSHFFAMTSLEDEVLEAMRVALPQFGVQCDALTGDGLLARPTCEAATPLAGVLRALEGEVLSRTGVAVKLAGKTLDGNKASEWPTRVHASSAPDSSAGFRLAEFCSGDG